MYYLLKINTVGRCRTVAIAGLLSALTIVLLGGAGIGYGLLFRRQTAGVGRSGLRVEGNPVEMGTIWV